jgi:hypothetical protein
VNARRSVAGSNDVLLIERALEDAQRMGDGLGQLLRVRRRLHTPRGAQKQRVARQLAHRASALLTAGCDRPR